MISSLKCLHCARRPRAAPRSNSSSTSNSSSNSISISSSNSNNNILFMKEASYGFNR